MNVTLNIEERVMETIFSFQVAYRQAAGRRCEDVILWMNTTTAQFLKDSGVAVDWPQMTVTLGDKEFPFSADFWLDNNIYVTSQAYFESPARRHKKRIYRKVYPDDWERFFDQKNPPPLYYCICRRGSSDRSSSPLNCICRGGGKLTRAQALDAYGFIPYFQEIPYCHVCGCGKNKEELFPYSFCEFGTVEDSNFKMIYRCRNHHGHDEGWSFRHVLTDNIITL